MMSEVKLVTDREIAQAVLDGGELPSSTDPVMQQTPKIASLATRVGIWQLTLAVYWLAKDSGTMRVHSLPALRCSSCEREREVTGQYLGACWGPLLLVQAIGWVYMPVNYRLIDEGGWDADSPVFLLCDECMEDPASIQIFKDVYDMEGGE